MCLLALRGSLGRARTCLARRTLLSVISAIEGLLRYRKSMLVPKLSDSSPRALIFGSKSNLYKRPLLNVRVKGLSF